MKGRTGALAERWWVRLGLVVVAGLGFGLSFQPTGWWPLLLIALPLLTRLSQGVSARAAFGLGYAFGLAGFLVSLGWIYVLGVPVAAALIGFMALYTALLAMGLRLIGRSRWWPLWAAALWVSCEFVFSRVPFGGFGWNRLAYAAVDTPLSGWLAVIGIAGTSFLVALCAHLIAYVGMRVWSLRGSGLRVSGERALRRAVAAIAVVVAIVVAGGLGRGVDPVVNPTTGEAVVVGIVQGNVPGKGMEALGRMRTVTNNHLAETIRLAAMARLGMSEAPDMVLWPENSTDIDPNADPITYRTIDLAAEVAQVPVFVGAVTYGPQPGERQTTAMWWVPGVGPVADYHKRNLVPFGEWVPFREVLVPIVPILERVGAQGVPGTEPGVLTVPLVDGREIKVGDLICFELAYDTTVTEMITAGAQLVLVQSNNASYGGTGQIEQQFAITRARAMETRREFAVATTNSVSGAIDRRGEVDFRTAEFTSDSRTYVMPLRTGFAPAVLVGSWVDRVISLIGIAAAVVIGLRTRRSSTAQPRA